MASTTIRDRIADRLARAYDGQALSDLRDEHAGPHIEAADAVLATLEDVEVSVYRITLLPPSHPMHAFAAVSVRLCDSGRWQVDRLGYRLDSGGRWEHAAKRSAEWVAEREFSLDEALTLARAAAPHVSIGDSTVGALVEDKP